jgi:glucan endo-1,3-alpha-glucosidase
MQFTSIALVALAATAANAQLHYRQLNDTVGANATTSAASAPTTAPFANGTSTANTTVSGGADISGWTYLGCFADTSGFPGFVIKSVGSSNSVDDCTARCSASGFQYSGLLGS